jgi:hypothetical protein
LSVDSFLPVRWFAFRADESGGFFREDQVLSPAQQYAARTHDGGEIPRHGRCNTKPKEIVDEVVAVRFLPRTRTRHAGVQSCRNAQLFFDVCATKLLKCGTTFELWHLGHFTSAFSRSEKVMITSKGLLHFSHMNS